MDFEKITIFNITAKALLDYLSCCCCIRKEMRKNKQQQQQQQHHIDLCKLKRKLYVFTRNRSPVFQNTFIRDVLNEPRTLR